jgi:hypothetical protein
VRHSRDGEFPNATGDAPGFAARQGTERVAGISRLFTLGLGPVTARPAKTATFFHPSDKFTGARLRCAAEAVDIVFLMVVAVLVGSILALIAGCAALERKN